MHLVRENLFIGNISDAAEVLQNGTTEVTHVLSVLSSASISFFTEWRSSLTIPSEEIKKVYVGGSGGPVNSEDVGGDGSKSCLSPEKLLYSLQHAGKDLKFMRMAVPIKDTESEVLLDYLDPCLEFIEKSRKVGSVLVHCFAGVSRRLPLVAILASKAPSFGMHIFRLYIPGQGQDGVVHTAAIITAYLMRSEQLSAEDALESLRQSCNFVCPNDGFIEQLQMFEKMGFKVNRDSPIYKKFRLRVMGDSYNRGEKIDSSKFAADPGLPTEAPSEVKASPNGPVDRKIAYRCKKCRRIVASQENVVDHVPGEGESSFGWNKRRGGNPFNKSDEFECSSVFIEPLRWMTAVEEGALEGKLSCAHCDARLGYFNWSGIQCSCGSWITPAFQLHRSRVDISTA